MSSRSMDDFEHFQAACSDYRQYPKNIIQHDAFTHTLKGYNERLQRNASRLFVGDNAAAVDFIDLASPQQGASSFFTSACVRSLCDLIAHSREALRKDSEEPQCRFVFIHARHSRARLNISMEMFCWLSSYLQAPPSFLDFVFPFGDQEDAQDFYFTGFKAECPLIDGHQKLSLPQLGRSGRSMTLCYNLRSVEVSRGSAEFPWSIRQTAVHHTFDFENGKALWLTVKGNTIMKKRISELIDSWESLPMDSVPGSFSATLRVHLLVCDWSTENWRWYINDLEDSFRGLTRHVLSTVVDRPASPPIIHPEGSSFAMSNPASPRSQNGPFQDPFGSGLTTAPGSPAGMRPARTFSSLWNTRTLTTGSFQQSGLPHSASEKGGTMGRIASVLKHKILRKSQLEERNASISSSEKSGESREDPPELPPGITEVEPLHTTEEVKFSDLQRVQHIEDKTHEVTLVLQLNLEVLHELREHYAHLATNTKLPSTIRDQCAADVANFQRSVSGVEKDLRMQRSRAETLLRLLADRKSFLYGILQYQSMRTSVVFAKKAHISAKNMETLTNSMHEIAQKTKQETVSMRIITLVTLFFLPGTFIGTLMSTDIIKFEAGVQKFQWRGLRLYLLICLPLMLVTFLAWWVVSRLVEREKKKSASSEPLGYSLAV